MTRRPSARYRALTPVERRELDAERKRVQRERVLAALARSPTGELYSPEVGEALGWPAWQAKALLRALEAGGWLESRWCPASGSGSGHGRRYYRVAAQAGAR